jgi:hypothetical protein
MIVDRDGQSLLGMILPDAMPVQMPLDVGGLWHGELGGGLPVLGRKLLVQDALAQGDAIVADVNARTGDELSDFRVGLSAKAAKSYIGRARHGIVQKILSDGF